MYTKSPNSNADSAVKSFEDGLTYFVKPFESVCVSFQKFILVCRPLFGVQVVLRGGIGTSQSSNYSSNFSWNKNPVTKIVVGRTVFYFPHSFTKFKCPKDGPFDQILASPFVFSILDHGC